MIRKRFLSSFLILITLAFIADTTASETSKFNQKLEAFVNGKQAVTEVAGMQMVLLRKGQTLLDYAGGIAHVSHDGKITVLTPSHKVRVASISKFVMALGFMTLVESGKVDLDADVSIYLGFKLRNPHFPNKKITAKQLLTHTSSIRDAGVYFLPFKESFSDFFTESEHYNNGAHFASIQGQAPGEYFNYANLNFGILAGIIEKVTSTRFDVFMDQTLFKPLGLDVSFNSCRFSNKNHSYIATLYRRGMRGETWAPDDAWKPQVDDSERRCYYGGPLVDSANTHEVSELSTYIPGSNPTLFSPQGGLRASANDLASLLKLLMSKGDLGSEASSSILSRNTIDEMLNPVWQSKANHGVNNGHTGGEADIDDIESLGLKNAYGLSTHIINLKDWRLSTSDSIWYGHMADAYGLLGQMWFNPMTDEAIVILLTGMGDDPNKPKKTTPMAEVEAQALRLALEGLRTLH